MQRRLQRKLKKLPMSCNLNQYHTGQVWSVICNEFLTCHGLEGHIADRQQDVVKEVDEDDDVAHFWLPKWLFDFDGMDGAMLEKMLSQNEEEVAE